MLHIYSIRIRYRRVDPELSERVMQTVEKIEEKVAKLRVRATAGDADAQFSLGRMYYFGLGVPKDEQEAAKWFGKSGYPRGRLNWHDLGGVR